ncbi:MAG: S-layer homology domain-containing protein [Clostridia bacterium]|nr:S-layer homology domain-containing protein [Clostridia bacterium]
MRNLKKFLALVLAMLMVSACAVSVSAFSDDAAIKEAGYEEAVAALASAGIITGRNDGTGNYYPNDVLTREEFVVVMSKIVAGEDFASFDWSNKTTCMATDVVDQWSFGYIDFAISKGFMQGDGSGAFNPKGVLTVAEAITAAVKAVPELAYEVKMQEFLLGAPAYWAQYYLAIAEEAGLTENVPTFDPTAQITRAQMAQVGYNLINFLDIFQPEEPEVDESIITVEGIIVELSDSRVIVIDEDEDEYAFNRAAIEAKLGDVELGDYVLSGITVVYDEDTNAIISVELENYLTIYTYLDEAIEIDDEYITIDGVEYIMDDDQDSEVTGGIGGGMTEAEDGIVVFGLDDGELPQYYKAYAYNLDGEDGFDLVVVYEYHLAVLIEGEEFEVDDEDIACIEIEGADGYYFTNAVEELPYVMAGIEVELDEETPVVVGVIENDGEFVVEVLAVAEEANGTLTSISKDGDITIDGEAIDYHDLAVELNIDDYVWMLNQPFNYFVLDGEFVITYEWYDEVEGQIENVVINENGNAVVTLITEDLEYEEIVVVGYANGKLIDLKAFQNYDEDEEEFTSWIYLAKEQLEDDDIDDYLSFWDTDWSTFVVTQKGAYLVDYITSDVIYDNITSGTEVTDKFEAKGDYIYVDGTATYENDDFIVIEREEIEEDDDDFEAYNYEMITYSFSEKLPSADTLTVYLYDEDWNEADTLGDAVKYIYLVDDYTATPDKVVAKLEGTLVYVNDDSVVDYTLNTTSYMVVDLFAGEEIEVVLDDSKEIEIDAGEFYIVKDGKIDSAVDSKWILDAEKVDLKSVYDGLVGKITGNYVEFVNDVASYKSAEYGLDLVIYEVEDGEIVLDDGEAETLKAADLLLKGANTELADSYEYIAYSVKGQMIVLAQKNAQ